MSHEQSVSFTTTTGFRTIQLVQSPYSQEDVDVRGITPGDQWHFEINGKAFYAKGTNIIPFDPFYARTKPEAVKWVLESAVKSGQNMVSSIWNPLLITSNPTLPRSEYGAAEYTNHRIRPLLEVCMIFTQFVTSSESSLGVNSSSLILRTRSMISYWSP